MERKPYKNALENRKYIIYALADIMKTKPFHEITTTEVCKRAGVSKNTFYRHFENLSDVIYQAIDEINEKLMEELFSIKQNDFLPFIKIVCKAWYENRDLYQGFTQDEVIYIIRNFMRHDSERYFGSFCSEDEDCRIFF